MAAPWIQILQGNKFDYREFRAADIHALDIAFSLGAKCRYNGYTKAHYSVAEHCVHLARKAMKQDCGVHMALWALLHDGGEAYLADMPGPLKDTSAMAPFRAMEDAILRSIAHRFDLRDPADPDLLMTTVPEWVKAHDLLILHDEALQVFDEPPTEDWHLKYAPGCGVTVQFLERDDAQQVYFRVLSDLLVMREDQR